MVWFISYQKDCEILTLTICFIPNKTIFTRAGKIPNTILTRGIGMARPCLITFINVYKKLVKKVDKKLVI